MGLPGKPDGIDGSQVETYFNDYRTVNGVKIAFRLDSDSPGGKNKQQIIIDHAEVDKPVDPALFQPPKP